jgi:hypothetical protein
VRRDGLLLQQLLRAGHGEVDQAIHDSGIT